GVWSTELLLDILECDGDGGRVYRCAACLSLPGKASLVDACKVAADKIVLSIVQRAVEDTVTVNTPGRGTLRVQVPAGAVEDACQRGWRRGWNRDCCGGKG